MSPLFPDQDNGGRQIGLLTTASATTSPKLEFRPRMNLGGDLDWVARRVPAHQHPSAPVST
jgi:hypothetical protein